MRCNAIEPNRTTRAPGRLAFLVFLAVLAFRVFLAILAVLAFLAFLAVLAVRILPDLCPAAAETQAFQLGRLAAARCPTFRSNTDLPGSP